MSQTLQSNTRRILLRPVTTAFSSFRSDKKQKGTEVTTARGLYNFNGEIQLTSSRQNLTQKELQDENQPKFQFKLIEDPRQSQFNYKKYILLQKLLLLISVFWIFLCIIRTQIIQLPDKIAAIQDWRMVIIMNIVSFATILLIFIRGVIQNQLHIDQKKFYCIRYKTGMFANIGRYLQQKQNLIYFLGQLCVLIWQPTTFTQNYKFSMLQSYDQVMVKHDFNTIMCLISMWRIYIVIRALINIQAYSSPRAVRLCEYNKVDHNIMYCMKCLLQEKPLSTIVTVFFTQQIVLAYAIRISEGFIQQDNPGLNQTGFEDYFTCFWFIFITMTTVGYGDYFPKTFPGRIVAFLAAFSGIILSSLMIVSLSAYLTMKTTELRSHLTLIRLKHQKRLQDQATQALIQTMKLSQYLSSQQKQNDAQKVKNLFIKLKYKIDTVKFRSRKIKSIVNSNNIIEEMNRLFEVLKQSIYQSYQHQVNLRKEIENLPKNKKKFDRKKMETIFLPQNLDLNNMQNNISTVQQ